MTSIPPPGSCVRRNLSNTVSISNHGRSRRSPGRWWRPATPDGTLDDEDRANRIEFTFGPRNPATGMTRFHGQLDDVGVEIVSQAIDGLAKPRPAAAETPIDPGEPGHPASADRATGDRHEADGGGAEGRDAGAASAGAGGGASVADESETARPEAPIDHERTADSTGGPGSETDAAFGEAANATRAASRDEQVAETGTASGAQAAETGAATESAAVAEVGGTAEPDAASEKPGTGIADESGPSSGIGKGADARLPDPRSASCRRGQALVEALRRFLTLGDPPIQGGERPHVTVTIDLKDLTSDRGVGYLDFGGPISAGTARMLACDAMVIPAVLGSNSQVLDVGMASRLFPTPIRRAIALRDKGCAFPGCDRPAAWAECHHISHWVNHGPSSYENGCLLCPAHHAEIHRGHWEVRMASDGFPEFLPPEWIDPLRQPLRNNYHRIPDLLRTR